MSTSSSSHSHGQNSPSASPINYRTFVRRHLGAEEAQTLEMLALVGADSLNDLMQKVVPAAIHMNKTLDLPAPKTEQEFLASFKQTASGNKIMRSFIGMGYYGNFTPNVVLRNILENPGWYTAYTPYQAEIAQGRLEMLINFQTVVTDLTGMDIAGASLLDEATAGAEAMTMLYANRKNNNANVVLVDQSLFPQTLALLETRAAPLGIVVQKVNLAQSNLTELSANAFAIFVQYPAQNGALISWKSLFSQAKELGLNVACATDLLALTLLTPPGEIGADVVFGSSQRFGVPMGFGGPSAAFMAVKDAFKRTMPGRLIGISKDAHGNPAYRMTLQTREQHIRREKATSNICTSQVLLAVMAASYAVWHGPAGLKAMATRVHNFTLSLKNALADLGYNVPQTPFFDTLSIDTPLASAIAQISVGEGYNFWVETSRVQISLDQTVTEKDIRKIAKIFALAAGKNEPNISFENHMDITEDLLRTSDYLSHPVFNIHHTEHEMLRYLKGLENKDLSMVHSMISLGSCTMKLNATTEMIPVTWPEFATIHPFVPADQRNGYTVMITELEKWLAEITGFAGVSLQPNSGAQGEYAGLLTIKAFQQANGQGHRNIALIPSSAHGTNPATANMCGLKVVVTACDENGNVDVDDLKAKIEIHKDNLAVLMVTYPSTHGVFEERIQEICELIHANGGQVYMDGANLNAQLGWTSPGFIGADVCHLNLHKTFCIPHGGGGPGVGPIGVAAHLVEYLPNHTVVKVHNNVGSSPVSASPWGSASILPIPYAYIAMMGADGLKAATAQAILNANYLRVKLQDHYPVLYTGSSGYCAHEFILDCRGFKKTSGVQVEDIAKRLMDYGFHAPTVSFPVAGTLMIEPTESESKEELDRFADALVQIRAEIAQIENGVWPQNDNPLVNAPHTAVHLIADEWTHAYSREVAAYPLKWVRHHKFWPSVGRIDNAYGDRNVFCSCLPADQYV